VRPRTPYGALKTEGLDLLKLAPRPVSINDRLLLRGGCLREDLRKRSLPT
jgi:hypothetical protein